MTFIIAEAGTCHMGDVNRAIEYVFAASAADAVKFQIFDRPETMFCWIDGDEARAPRWRDSRLSLDEWADVRAACDAAGVMFLASVFEPGTVQWMHALDAPTKVASRAAESFPYDLGRPPYYVSLGMTDTLPGQGYDVTYLECEARYPSSTPWMGIHPGFSDHSGDIGLPLDAIRRGVELLEVHFFIDPDHAGPDLPASLTVDQLETLCENRRNA